MVTIRTNELSSIHNPDTNIMSHVYIATLLVPITTSLIPNVLYWLFKCVLKF
jgi:hypothetical protein